MIYVDIHMLCTYTHSDTYVYIYIHMYPLCIPCFLGSPKTSSQAAQGIAFRPGTSLQRLGQFPKCGPREKGFWWKNIGFDHIGP